MFNITIISQPIPLSELINIAGDGFGDMVKAVVDCKRDIMAIGGELHADEEHVLLEDGSNQQDLWGINLYPNESFNNWIEFDSMINLRPSQNNRSRSVEDPKIQDTIRTIVAKLIK